MKIGNIDLEKKPFIVAEIGNNHEGSYALAEELIGLARESGADAVKFQTFLPEHYVARGDSVRYERLKRFQLSYQEFECLAQHAKKAGIIFFSTPFDLESARFLNSIQDFFKISSGDNTFYPLIETVASFGKPIILSTGIAGSAELHAAKNLIEKTWQHPNRGGNCFLAMLHCVSSYPVIPEEVSLATIRILEKEFGCVVGYSDHSLGIDAAAASVLLGARIIEKHFTKDKNFSDFRDHQLSADPADFRALVDRVTKWELLLGKDREKVIQKSERGNIALLRRSIVASRELDAGAIIGPSDITWVRPGSGIAPGQESLVLGRKLKRKVASGEQLLADNLE